MTNDNCKNPCISCNPPIGGAAGLGLSPLDPQYPFVNLSSEAPDVDLFISRRGSGLGLPPLGSTWYSVGCLGFCFSATSQDEADICAAQQAALCVVPNWPVMIPNPNPGPGEPEFIPQDRQLFYNFQQSAQFTCPDGSLFTYFVPAGTFSALNQEAADAWAASYAEIKAVQNYICVGSIESLRTCIGGQYQSVIFVLAANKPIGAEVTSGVLPPGIDLQQGASPNQPTVIISGVPTAGGNYPFSITITDSLGNKSVKSYTISVFGLSGASQLPDPVIGEAYSYFLTLDGAPDGAVLFSVVSGSLPAGLSLNPTTGEIDGTPTEEGAFQFTAQAQDSSLSCQKQFDIFVQPQVSSCGVFADLVWLPPVLDAGNGSASGSASQNSCDGACSCSPFDPFTPNQTASVFLQSSMVYTGDEISCNIYVNTSISDSAGMSIQVLHDGNPIVNQVIFNSDSVVIPVVIPASVAAVINVNVDGGAGVFDFGDGGTIEFDVTFGA